MGDSPAADGWSHYSYPDSTGSKKMRTDGEEPPGFSAASSDFRLAVISHVTATEICSQLFFGFFFFSFQEMSEQARSEAVESKTSEGWLKTA